MQIFVPTHSESILADGRNNRDHSGPIQDCSYFNIFQLILIEHGAENRCKLTDGPQHGVLEFANLDLIEHKIVRKVTEVGRYDTI